MSTHFQGAGKGIRDARRARGLSQVQLSKQLGIGQGTLSRAETSTDVRFGTLLEISRALDLEIMLIPRRLVPAIDAIVRHGTAPAPAESDDDELYDEAYDEPSTGER